MMRIKLLTLLFILGLLTNGWTEITFDNVSSSESAGISPMNISHTIAGDNRILFVGAVGDSSTTQWRTVSGITYNAVALTKATTREANNLRVELWYLLNPDLGTHNITISWGAAVGRNGGGISFAGVNQTAPESVGNNGNVGSSMSTAVTPTTDNSWAVDAVAWEAAGYKLTVGAGQTVRVSNNTTGCTFGMSHEGPQTPAGAITMSWTKDGSDDEETICAATIAPYSAPPAGDVGTQIIMIN
jgi:hypothetical protein